MPNGKSTQSEQPSEPDRRGVVKGVERRAIAVRLGGGFYGDGRP